MSEAIAVKITACTLLDPRRSESVRANNQHSIDMKAVMVVVNALDALSLAMGIVLEGQVVYIRGEKYTFWFLHAKG